MAALRASQAPPPADEPLEPPAKAPAPCADGGGGGSSSGGGNAAAPERQQAAAAASTRMHAKREEAAAALQVGIQLLLLFPGRAACYHNVLAVLASRLSDAMCPLNTGSGAAEQRYSVCPG